MPIITDDITLTGATTPEIVAIRCEQHIVKSISLFHIEHATYPTDAYAEIGVMSGGKLLINRIALMNAGYIGLFASLGWNGSFPTEPDTFVYAALLGPNTHEYRLCVTLWKIVATREGAFIVDP